MHMEMRTLPLSTCKAVRSLIAANISTQRAPLPDQTEVLIWEHRTYTSELSDRNIALWRGNNGLAGDSAAEGVHIQTFARDLVEIFRR